MENPDKRLETDSEISTANVTSEVPNDISGAGNDPPEQDGAPLTETNNASQATPATEINSVTALLKILQERGKRREKEDRQNKIVWYRGHADENWELLPAVLRKWFRMRVEDNENYQPKEQRLIIEMELVLNGEFRRRGISLLTGKFSDEVDIYFLAQHHGIPTRLLDWTQNPLTALFFAVTSSPKCNGMFYALDPCWPVNKGEITDWSKDKRAHYYLGGVIGPFDKRHHITEGIIKYLFKGSGYSESFSPIPVNPDLHAGRMLQQGSCFTLHAPLGPPFIPQPFIDQFVIPSKYKREIQDELRHLGINWATLFPDLDRLAYEIRASLDLNL